MLRLSVQYMTGKDRQKLYSSIALAFTIFGGQIFIVEREESAVSMNLLGSAELIIAGKS